MRSVAKGPLTESIECYLAHKRALGKQLIKTGGMLHLLDDFLLTRDIADARQIVAADLDAFVASRPRHSAASYNGLIGAIRGLLDWMVIHDILPESPMQCELRRVLPSRRPFLFTPAQARCLLEAAQRLPSTPRAQNRGRSIAGS